jgi:trehalose-phosphatase
MTSMSASATTPQALAAEVLEAASRPWSVRTLLLDLDGTLAPIADRPENAVVPEETKAVLARLVAAGWRIGVVSGRSGNDARGLLGVQGVHVFGSHGAEGTWGGRETGGPSLAVRQRLQALAGAASRLTWYVEGSRVEVKPAGIAFHDREVSDEDLGRWRELVEELLARHDLEGLERLEGQRVLELKPRGQHKGRVLHRLPRRSTAATFDASLVAMGDDDTDEEMFLALGNTGLSVRVADTDVPTRAVRRLESPEDVTRFLQLLADAEEQRLAGPGGTRTL